MISVVIPLYNKVKTVACTLATVQAQTYSDYEIVVIDDGSTDGSADVVRSINDSRIRLFSQPNAGVSAARNRGIEEARGDFVAFLDADDEWKPDYLETQMYLVNKYPQCDVFATRYGTYSRDGRFNSAIVRKLPFHDIDGVLNNYFQVASCSEPPLFTSAVMVRRTAIQAVGGFPVGIKSGEDLITWARLAVKNNIAYTTSPKVVFSTDGLDFSIKPKRSNDEDNYVGRELVSLQNSYNPPHINQYISHWYKMRSSVFLRQGQRWKSIAEAMKGLRFYPCNYKLYLYILLNCLPTFLQPFKR